MEKNLKYKNNFKKILKKEVGMFFSQEFAHKEQLLMWIFADTIKILGLCFVWAASVKFTNVASQGYIVSYFILMLIFGKFTGDVVPELGVRLILSGKISNLLLKPFSYLTEFLGYDIGSNVFRLIASLPAFVLGIIVTKSLNLWIVEFNPYLIFLACTAAVLGFLINFLLGNIFSLLAFYNKNMDGMRTFYYNITAFVSGGYAPLVAFPYAILFFIQLLPFRYTLSFPIEIMLGRMTNYDITYGFIIAGAWLIILFVLFNILYLIASRKYAAEGI